MEKVKRVKEKKPIYKRKWFIFLAALFLLVAIGNMMGGDGDSAEDTQGDPVAEEPAAEPEEPAVELTKEEQVDQVVIDVLGAETNMGETRIVNRHFFEEDGGVSLTLIADENLTASMMMSSMSMDTKDLFEELFKMDGVTSTFVAWQTELIDQYGNSEFRDVVHHSLDKETADKINWENIMTDSFSDLTLEWVHPALQ